MCPTHEALIDDMDVHIFWSFCNREVRLVCSSSSSIVEGEVSSMTKYVIMEFGALEKGDILVILFFVDCGP